MGVTITVTGIPGLLDKLRPEVVEPVITRAFDDATAVIMSQVRTPRYTGKLGSSKHREIIPARPFPVLARVWVGAPHAHLLEFGTKPHFPALRGTVPAPRLRGWVRARVQPQSLAVSLTTRKPSRRLPADQGKRALDEATFLIARAIASRGTRPRPYFLPAVQAAEPLVFQVFANAMGELEAIWQA